MALVELKFSGFNIPGLIYPRDLKKLVRAMAVISKQVDLDDW